ncbi:MAG: hypothetical protein H0U76_10815 [Ktedonobacteraceae bacterium]|nr:hypothetical protein [Ktedonobacteraceae bacterium]
MSWWLRLQWSAASLSGGWTDDNHKGWSLRGYRAIDQPRQPQGIVATQLDVPIKILSDQGGEYEYAA